MTEFVREAFFELQLRLFGVRVGVAVGPRGLVIAIQRGDRQYLITVGRVR